MAKKLTLDIDDDLWQKFQATVPRNKKLNDAVVDLIKGAVEKQR